MSKSNLFDCLKEDISSDSNSDDNKSPKKYYKNNYNRKYTKINENKPQKYKSYKDIKDKKHDIINNDNIINKEEEKFPKYSPKNYKRINYLNDNLEEYKKESPTNNKFNKFNKFKNESPTNNKFKNDYKVSKEIKEENEIKSSKIFNKMKCTKEFTEKIINNRKFYNEDCNISYSIKDCIYNKRSLTLKKY